MLVVKYHPNQFDLEARPKDDYSIAIVAGKSKRTLPSKKNEEGGVTETKEVDALDLMVLQSNGSVLTRKSVVSKSDHVDTALKYQLSYYEPLEADKELADKVAALTEEVAALKAKINSAPAQ